jgi:hypothetical protein
MARKSSGKKKGGKKQAAKKKQQPPQDVPGIVKLWKRASKDGLGSKDFHPDEVVYVVQPLLEESIQKELDKKRPFTKDDERQTKDVGKRLGRICREATAAGEKHVSYETFYKAWDLVRPTCLARGGLETLGEWCSITLPPPGL